MVDRILILAVVNLLVGFSFLALFSLVLLDKPYLVLVEVFEYVIVIKNVFLPFFAYLNSLNRSWNALIVKILLFFIILDAINLVEVFACPLLYIVESIKSIHVLNHVLRELFLFGKVALDKEGQWEIVKDILIQLFTWVATHCLEQFWLLAKATVALVMVHKLLLARVELNVYLFADVLEFNAAADSLPPKMEMRILIGRLFPILGSPLHS